MSHPLDAVLRDPWQLLAMALDGPLHPGGVEATERLLDRASVSEGTSVLDVGCGPGESLQLVRERDAEAIGLDRQATAPGAVQGDMSSLPFSDDSFDVVLGECVLCLSPALDRTLSEIGRVLKPGGRLALSDVTVEGTAPELPSPFDELLCLDGPRDRTYIREHLVEAGLQIDNVRSHHEDLLAMRDRIRSSLDTERLTALLGDREPRLREGAEELESAVESGQIGYVSIVATNF